MGEHDARRSAPIASTLVSTRPPDGTGEMTAHADTQLAPGHSSPARVKLEEAFVQDDGFATRYERGGVLGQGGMGEVRVCHDHRVGRDVALKVVRPGKASDELTARFVREARVQGQLEHPAIVPVYDMGVAPDGSPYFTMKRVRGHTLEGVLEALRAGKDEEARRRFSTRKLLTAFASLCLAVDFVHGRGVVHRDIKPANVMLGDFGEVYLLDWGLARVDEETTELRASRPQSGEGLARLSPGITSAGELLGTPGYMAPEQLELAVGGQVDARADVYSLGAILFELLTLQHLHRGTAADALARSTRAGADARASVRAPQADVPPELEAACMKATAQDPAERFPTARALCDAVERYLDGDRDLALRRRLAETHARAASEAVARALAGSGAAAVDDRRTAMREVSSALALDGRNADAMRALVDLLVQPPRDLPPAVKEEMAQLARDQIHVGARTGALAYGSMLFYVPLVLWMGVRSGWAAVLYFAFAAVAAAASWSVTRVRRPSPRHVWVVYAASLVSIAALSSFFGPMLLVPGIAATSALIYSATNDRSMRLPIIALACVPLLAPLALEWLGVVGPSMRFVPEGLLLVPRVVGFPPLPTYVFLLATNVAVVVTAGLALVPFREGFDDAQRRVRLLAWQLRQLVPEEATAGAAE
jgi:serine/threonine-protein kinase